MGKEPSASPDEGNDEASFRHFLVGSATSGLFARVLCHPLDTCKSKIQGPEGNKFTSTPQTLTKIFRQEGIPGLYKGFGAVFVGGTPGLVIYLTSYELLKNTLVPVFGGSKYESLAHIFSGFVAEALCCVTFVPVDVVKERMQVQGSATSFAYKNSLDAFKQIMQQEGLRGIYKGYGATLLSFGPYSALYFAFYEKMKEFACEIEESSVDTLSFKYLVASATGSACLASWLTNPLDLAKLRLQVQRSSSLAAKNNADGLKRSAVAHSPHHSQQYSSMLDGVAKIYRAEGLRGLYRGAGARVAFQAPNMALTVSLFDVCKNFFAQYI